MNNDYKKALLTYLSEFVSANKQEKSDAVLKNRTRHITLLLEDIYQSHNASAVLRSCDCFGIQDVYAVEERNKFTVTETIDRGASKWLDVYRYKKIQSVYADLKEKGYRIIATTPDKKATPLANLSIENKCCLVFGTEFSGVSDYIFDHADELVTIPMYGFTESLNISVSVGISLYALTKKLHESNFSWRLPREEQLDIKLGWYKRIVRGSKGLEERFVKNWQNNN